MDLETVMQSEVSQKEKNKYHVVSLICGIQKNGTDQLICKAEIDVPMQKTNVWISRRREGGMNWKIGIDVSTQLCVKQITNENLVYSKRNSILSALWCPKQQENPKKRGYVYMYN